MARGHFLAAAVVLFISGGRASPGAEVYRFQNRPLRAGDQVTQETELGMKLKITATSNTAASTSVKNLQRHQLRSVTLLTSASAAEPRARLTFEEARQRQQYAAGVETNIREPVAGKSYLIARRGDALVVTDLAGNAPPEEERALVASSMEAFGRPNPLSNYMNRRAMALGETMRVPRAVAEQIFTAWRDMLEIEAFELTLSEVKSVNGNRCGIFQAVIQGAPTGNSQHLAQLRGRVAIELETCRIPLIELAGPIRLSQTQSGDEGPVNIDCQGSISVAMRSRGVAR